MDEPERADFDRALNAGLRFLDTELSARQCEKLWLHRQRVVEANRRFNLTRITDPVEFAVKHHLDSLALLAWVAKTGARVSRVLDVGTGAGIPAVPLAIARPDWNITAIDGTAKKVRFVAELTDELDLDNLTCRHARAESWRGETTFDLVLFKAVGSIARCLRNARRHLPEGGTAALYKTAALADKEADEASQAACKLGFELPARHAYQLPLGDEAIRREIWLYRLIGRQPSRLARGR